MLSKEATPGAAVERIGTPTLAAVPCSSPPGSSLVPAMRVPFRSIGARFRSVVGHRCVYRPMSAAPVSGILPDFEQNQSPTRPPIRRGDRETGKHSAPRAHVIPDKTAFQRTHENSGLVEVAADSLCTYTGTQCSPDFEVPPPGRLSGYANDTTTV